MQYKDSKLEFTPSSAVTHLVEPCHFNIKLPVNQQLVHISHYRIGTMYTDKGNPVITMSIIKDAFDLDLTPIQGELKLLFGQYPFTKLLDHLNLRHDEFIPHYNCFGFCFAESQFRIPDPTQILKDEYLECEENESEIVVSFNNNTPVHAALRKENKYIAKSGVMALETFDNYGLALAGIPHNQIKFYKPLSKIT
jgi:hypothetical protein